MPAKEKIKKRIYVSACLGAAIVGGAISLVMLCQRNDRECLKILTEAGWHVRERSYVGVGSGSFTGQDFISGEVGDITFAAYVIEGLGISISNDDALYGYEYVLEETCIERPFRAYFLARNGKLLCGAIWYVEVVEGLGTTTHGPDDYYPVNTPIGQLRREAIRNLTQ